MLLSEFSPLSSVSISSLPYRYPSMCLGCWLWWSPSGHQMMTSELALMAVSITDVFLGTHGIIEWLGLEGTSKTIQFQPPAMGRASTHQLRLPRAPFNMALNISTGRASTVLGSPFQHFTSLSVKNFPLTSNLNLPAFSLKASPLVLSLSTCVKSWFHSFCNLWMCESKEILWNNSRGFLWASVSLAQRSCGNKGTIAMWSKSILGEAFIALWLFSIWSLGDTIDIQCAVYFIRWKSTHWGIVSFPKLTLWQRAMAVHIKMIKALLKSLAAQVEERAWKLLIDGLDSQIDTGSEVNFLKREIWVRNESGRAQRKSRERQMRQKTGESFVFLLRKHTSWGIMARLRCWHAGLSCRGEWGCKLLNKWQHGSLCCCKVLSVSSLYLVICGVCLQWVF